MKQNNQKDIIGFIKCWMDKLQEIEDRIDDPVWVVGNDNCYCQECEKYINGQKPHHPYRANFTKNEP